MMQNGFTDAVFRHLKTTRVFICRLGCSDLRRQFRFVCVCPFGRIYDVCLDFLCLICDWCFVETQSRGPIQLNSFWQKWSLKQKWNASSELHGIGTPSTSSGDWRTASLSCLCSRPVPLTGWIMICVSSLIHISPILNISSTENNLCNMVCPLSRDVLYMYRRIISVLNLNCLTGSGGLFWNGVGSFRVELYQGGRLQIQIPEIHCWHWWPSEYTRGCLRKKSLWGHCCGKSAAMRTHASKRTTRSPTKAILPSVCVNLDSIRMSEARVEGARSAIFGKTRSSDPIHHVHTHTQTHKSP